MTAFNLCLPPVAHNPSSYSPRQNTQTQLCLLQEVSSRPCFMTSPFHDTCLTNTSIRVEREGTGECWRVLSQPIFTAPAGVRICYCPHLQVRKPSSCDVKYLIWVSSPHAAELGGLTPSSWSLPLGSVPYCVTGAVNEGETPETEERVT